MSAKNQKTLKKLRWMNLFIHISTILMFFLPEIITNIDDNRPIPYGVVMKTLIYILLFYINYFTFNYFIDSKGGRWKFFGMNFLLLIGVSFIIYFTSHGYTDKKFHPVEKPPINHEVAISYGETPPPPHFGMDSLVHRPPHHPPHHKNSITHAIARLSRDLLVAILVIALAFAVRMTLRWFKEQRVRADLIASQREIELENLKSQVNPHFLFNTLNAIYALIDINPSQAQKAIHELSGLMRYALYETSEMVTLKQEIAFLKNYITLMEMRMGKKNDIKVSLSCNEHCHYMIAPLLFIPIIENAIKYGNTGKYEDSINIEIKVNDGVVKCHTFNHFIDRKLKEKKDSGIGITNLQRRLNLIYGKKASFKTICQNNTFEAELIIDLNDFQFQLTEK